MHLRGRLISWICIGVVLPTLTTSAIRSQSPVINPRTYVSPSGEFVLDVDPSDLYGRGAATYRVSKSGALVWTGNKPFTLYDGGITDTGIFAGFAYTYGIEGYPEVRTNDVPGEFHVVAVRPDGEIVLQDVVKRTSSRFLHCVPNPLAHGVLVDGPRNRLIVVINDEDVNRRQQQWWTYELSSGKSLSKSRRGPTVPPTSIPKPTQPQPLDLASLPVRPFKQLGSFSLEGAKESSRRSAIRDVVSFDIDDRERIGFIRREARDQYTFVFVSSEGQVLREAALTLPGRHETHWQPTALWV